MSNKNLYLKAKVMPIFIKQGRLNKEGI